MQPELEEKPFDWLLRLMVENGLPNPLEAVLPQRFAIAKYHQTICAVKYHSCALATFQR